MDRIKRILALYLASIIIGAGILALPLKAAKIGLIPMVCFTAFFAFFFYEAYKRVIEASLSIEGHIDLSTYDRVLERASLGKFSRIGLEYGMILYIIPADVVYTLFSASRYVKLAEISRGSKGFLGYFFLSTIVGYAISLSVMRREKLSKFFALLATRSLSVLILYALSLSYEASLALGAVLFMFTMLVGEYFPEYFVGEPKEVSVKEGEVHPRHYVAALYTIFKVLFILGIAFFSFLVVLYYKALPRDVLYIARDPLVILSGIGVTAFAFVGTGVYNIVMYDRLRRGEKRKAVLSLGTLIPAFLYITFTVLMTYSVDRSLLIEADRSMEPSLLALAEKLESLGISVSTGLLIGLAGIFTLLAVSMSYLGFTDTLGGRMTRYVGDYHKARLFSSFSATLIALVIVLLNPELSATGVLDVAGSAGGILFLLFLPFLFLRKRRDLLYALIALALIPLANLPAVLLGGTIEKLTALLSSSIALALGILSLYEYRRGLNRARLDFSVKVLPFLLIAALLIPLPTSVKLEPQKSVLIVTSSPLNQLYDSGYNLFVHRLNETIYEEFNYTTRIRLASAAQLTPDIAANYSLVIVLFPKISSRYENQSTLEALLTYMELSNRGMLVIGNSSDMNNFLRRFHRQVAEEAHNVTAYASFTEPILSENYTFELNDTLYLEKTDRNETLTPPYLFVQDYYSYELFSTNVSKPISIVAETFEGLRFVAFSAVEALKDNSNAPRSKIFKDILSRLLGESYGEIEKSIVEYKIEVGSETKEGSLIKAYIKLNETLEAKFFLEAYRGSKLSEKIEMHKVNDTFYEAFRNASRGIVYLYVVVYAKGYGFRHSEPKEITVYPKREKPKLDPLLATLFLISFLATLAALIIVRKEMPNEARDTKEAHKLRGKREVRGLHRPYDLAKRVNPYNSRSLHRPHLGYD